MKQIRTWSLAVICAAMTGSAWPQNDMHSSAAQFQDQMDYKMHSNADGEIFYRHQGESMPVGQFDFAFECSAQELSFFGEYWEMVDRDFKLKLDHHKRRQRHEVDGATAVNRKYNGTLGERLGLLAMLDAYMAQIDRSDPDCSDCLQRLSFIKRRVEQLHGEMEAIAAGSRYGH